MRKIKKSGIVSQKTALDQYGLKVLDVGMILVALEEELTYVQKLKIKEFGMMIW